MWTLTGRCFRAPMSDCCLMALNSFMLPFHVGLGPTGRLGEPGSTRSAQTLMRISSLCSQSLWFWKRFSSFQMFSSRSACVDASPGGCWVSCRERSDMRVAFSISTSGCSEETRERETVGGGGGGGGGRDGETLRGRKGKDGTNQKLCRQNTAAAQIRVCRLTSPAWLS